LFEKRLNLHHTTRVESNIGGYKIMKILVALLTTAFIGSTALAAGSAGSGVALHLAAMYSIDNSKLSSTTTNTSTVYGSFRVGYKFSSPLFVGGTYDMINYSASGTGASTTVTSGSYGPSVGLVTGGFFLVGTYLAGSTLDMTVGSTKTSYTSGSGFAADIGYTWMVGSKVGIGPMLKYSSVKWTKVKVGSAAETTTDYTKDNLDPYLAFHVQF
jgi:hypothetical protein